MRSPSPFVVFAGTLLAAHVGNVSGADTTGGTVPTDIALQVDALIEAALPSDARGIPLASDEDFLRRVTLDLAGTIPSPNEVTLFGLDPSADKRLALIDRLLESDDYAQIWSAYWAEVIFSHATEARSRIVQPQFESWMQEQLAANRPWDEITTELLTATGKISEDGETALIFAHTGQAEELAAEVSRIFLGIQLQCANCHDHPTDSWKREQFHQLAAFFPRITVRPETPGDIRTFVVGSNNTPERRAQVREATPEQTFGFLDRNRDGKVSRGEAEQRRFIGDRFAQFLEAADTNKDGALSLDEFKNLPRPPADQPGRGSPEHYMADLNDPSSRGTLMQPVFFADGYKLATGASDEDRREALARHITSKGNEWFARSFVNRVWAEMTGEGFYMPIDDIGPERTAQFPEALDLLADSFAKQDYDVKWLFRTIAGTQTYQREIRARVPGEDPVAFATASPTRLRSDQVYNSLTKVLGVDRLNAERGRGRGMLYAQGRDPGRAAFAQLFGFDPSTPQDDIVGSIPQALFLMNSPQLNTLIRGNGDTRLGRILQKFPDNRDALSEVYLLVLAREPSDKEIGINTKYIEQVGSRTEAFEDVLWSLLNSSEFLSKR
jgi:hypothetical protein